MMRRNEIEDLIARISLSKIFGIFGMKLSMIFDFLRVYHPKNWNFEIFRFLDFRAFSSDRGFGLDDDEEDRFGKGSFSCEEEKKKRKSGFRQRLGDLDDSTDLLDYLLDDSNFSPDQKSKKKMDI